MNITQTQKEEWKKEVQKKKTVEGRQLTIIIIAVWSPLFLQVSQPRIQPVSCFCRMAESKVKVIFFNGLPWKEGMGGTTRELGRNVMVHALQ